MGFKKYFDEYWNEEGWRKNNVMIRIKSNNTEKIIMFLVEKN
jgi:hypothetical protein